MCNGCNKNDNKELSTGALIIELIFIAIFVYFVVNFYSYTIQTSKLETEILRQQVEMIKQIN